MFVMGRYHIHIYDMKLNQWDIIENESYKPKILDQDINVND